MNDNADQDQRYRDAYHAMRETSVEKPLPWEHLHEQERNWFRAYADAYVSTVRIERKRRKPFVIEED